MGISDLYTNQVINMAWTNANKLLDGIDNRQGVAYSYVNGIAVDVAEQDAAPIQEIEKPDVDIPEAAVYDPEKYFEYEAQTVGALTTLFADFMATYFQLDPDLLRAVQEYSDRNLAGEPLKQSVVDGVWDKVTGDSDAIKTDVNNAVNWLWSNRGMPTPGSATYFHTLRVDNDAAEVEAANTAAQSGKTFDTKIEMTPFAIKPLLDMRQAAMDAAGDYISAYVAAQQTAKRAMDFDAERDANYLMAVSAFYNARTHAEKLMFKTRLSSGKLYHEQESTLRDADHQVAVKNLELEFADIAMLARTAAAMLNNLHATAGVEGNEKL